MWFTLDKGLKSVNLASALPRPLFANNGHFLGLYLNPNVRSFEPGKDKMSVMSKNRSFPLHINSLIELKKISTFSHCNA